MKFSLAWLCDHLAIDWHLFAIPELLEKLGKTTAEIEGFHTHSCAWDSFFIGEVRSATPQSVELFIAERNQLCTLPARPDAQIGHLFLVHRSNTAHQWALLADLGAEREGFVPALQVPATQLADGSWRAEQESEDVIIEIDNKSLTNRPDLWGHRGMAREIAALYNRKLVPEEQLCAPFPVHHFDTASPEINIESGSACTRFAGLTLSVERACPSVLWMSHRLARVDARAISALVDATNYTMYDFGHPMHAYDKDKITFPIIARQAKAGEALTLLDGEKIVLTSADCVIADAHMPLGLAGVMGGESSALTPKTRTLFIEAAHFAPAAIRLTAARFKKRTDSSARFEKGLDPNYTATVIQRFCSLLDELGVPYTTNSIIDSVGKLAPATIINVLHRFITDRLGAAIPPSHLAEILERLGFGIQMQETSRGLSYQLTVPSWRSFRDVRIPEDIVEEVGRFYGYDNIPPALPTRTMKPFSTQNIERRRYIRRHLAYACGMHEVATYPLFQEQWITTLNMPTKDCVTLLNPLSSQASQLVTTLIPNILECARDNAHQNDALRFFELGSIWHKTENNVDEKRVCSGIFAVRNAHIDFYQTKEYLQELFEMLDLVVTWHKEPALTPPWAEANECAVLRLENASIGVCARVKEEWAQKADVRDAYAFEIFEAPLLQKSATHHFEPLSKYQAVTLDVSVFAPRSFTVAKLEETIAPIDVRIRDIALVDIFEKAEWGDRRSVTLRYVIQDDEKTLSKTDIEEIQQAVHAALTTQGAEVRS